MIAAAALLLLVGAVSFLVFCAFLLVLALVGEQDETEGKE